MASVPRSRFSKALPSAPVEVVEMALPTPPKEHISITRRPIRPEKKKTDSAESLSALYNEYMKGLYSPTNDTTPPPSTPRKPERNESPERALPPPPSPPPTKAPDRELPPQPTKVSKYKNGPGNSVFPVKPKAKTQGVELKDGPVVEVSAEPRRQDPISSYETFDGASTMQRNQDTISKYEAYKRPSPVSPPQDFPTQSALPARKDSIQAVSRSPKNLNPQTAPLAHKDSIQAISQSPKDFTRQTALPSLKESIRSELPPRETLSAQATPQASHGFQSNKKHSSQSFPQRLSSPDFTREQSPQSYPRLPTPEYTSAHSPPPTITSARPVTPPAEPETMPISSPIVKAVDSFPLSIVQLECFQRHRTMRVAPNKACPTKCMVCATSKGSRWWCTWCCLGVCEGCRGALGEAKGDLSRMFLGDGL